GVYRAENVRMLHRETYRTMASHEVSSDAARIPVGQRFEIGINVRHQFLDHEIVPITCYGRVDVPGTSKGRVHIHRHQNEFVDDAVRNGVVEEALRTSLIEVGAIASEWIGKKVNYRIALRRFVITGGQIDNHLAQRVGADFRM